jgi:anti-sigma B factor antagonist
MDIHFNREESTLNVALDGRLDTTTAPMLEDQLQRELTEDVTELIFDFEKLEYMSSVGIRIIMAADEVMTEQDGEMKLVHVSEEIMDIFDMTGLVDLLNIE